MTIIYTFTFEFKIDRWQFKFHTAPSSDLPLSVLINREIQKGL